MKVTERYLHQNTFEALKRCLEEVPFVEGPVLLSQPDRGDTSPDLLLKVIVPDGEKHLIVERKTVGQPRIARNAVNQLLRYLRDFPDAYGVFAAPYISPRAAEICIKEGIGYLDLAGNCHLSFEQIYIEKIGNPNPFTDKRDLRSLYSPKAARILRVLLMNPQTAWRVQTLAKEANVSIGLVSKVKKLLADREWITAESEGLKLADPEDLLAEWADNYTYRKNEIREFYSLKSIPEIENGVAELLPRMGLRYALTGFSGADRLAPFTRYNKAMVYVDETDEDLATVLNLKKVTSGANVTLLTPYDEGVFYGTQQIGGLVIASPIQLYLDLYSYRGRGEEAAKELFEQVIRPTW